MIYSSYIASTTQEITVNGTKFTYRKTGDHQGIPIVLLNHLTGNLDNWDPRVVDGLAVHHTVITFNARGVGSSEGSVPLTIEAGAIKPVIDKVYRFNETPDALAQVEIGRSTGKVVVAVK